MGQGKRTVQDRLLNWWRGLPSTQKRRASTVAKRCEDDPEGSLAELQEEQGRLAQELEDTFRAYDAKVRSTAERLAGLSDEPVTDTELERLRNQQLELWRLVRRAQAAARSTRVLQQELREWSVRPEGTVPAGHPDHPATRAEIVASELRSRGADVLLKQTVFENDIHEARAVPTTFAVRDLNPDEPPVEVEVTVLDAVPGPEWEHDEDAMLITHLRSRQKEMEKLMRQGADEENAQELAAFLGEMRELHAHLRLHDRRNGISRERYRMGVPSGM